MRLFKSSRYSTLCLIVSSILAVGTGRVWLLGDGIAPKTIAPESPINRGLDANLYMQTAAEYRACCLQAYNLATYRLQSYIAGRSNTDRPVAVIMDLDETVFDNAGFQAMQVRSRLAFDTRLWEIWEAKHGKQVRLIPGAKAFIEDARQRGATVVFISNRSAEYASQAKEALERLGIPVPDDGLLKLSTGSTDKTQRIAEVTSKYDLGLIVGDNLRDFENDFKCPDLQQKTPEQLEAAIQARKDRVDANASKWGERWIILPNPAYGEWTKPLGLGERDLERLVLSE